jgi:predicted kinase
MGGVVVLSGPPCSGKSVAAKALADEQSASGRRRQHLAVDSLFDILFPTSDRNREDRMRAYDGAHLLARMFAERGETVVLECTYARRDQRLSLVRALAGSLAPLWVAEFFVTPEEAVRRFRERDQATDLNADLVWQRVEEFAYFRDAFRIESANATPEAHARRIAAWLDQGPQPVDPDSWSDAGIGWS